MLAYLASDFLLYVAPVVCMKILVPICLANFIVFVAFMARFFTYNFEGNFFAVNAGTHHR